MDTKRLVVVAVGGQGNLIASSVLCEAALISEIPVRMCGVHGMAQRGGVVESSIVFGGARSPVISKGDADVLVSFEPSEALRALNRCNPKTVVITNLAPLPPNTVAIGRGVYPDIEKIKELISVKTARLVPIDAVALAVKAGNILSVNMVMLGALIQTAVLPLSAENVKNAISRKLKKEFFDVNLKAFDLGFAEADKTLT
jgi:indolepyruvate ferredoxin oxidoreductase beta subunit